MVDDPDVAARVALWTSVPDELTARGHDGRRVDPARAGVGRPGRGAAAGRPRPRDRGADRGGQGDGRARAARAARRSSSSTSARSAASAPTPCGPGSGVLARAYRGRVVRAARGRRRRGRSRTCAAPPRRSASSPRRRRHCRAIPTRPSWCSRSSSAWLPWRRRRSWQGSSRSRQTKRVEECLASAAQRSERERSEHVGERFGERSREVSRGRGVGSPGDPGARPGRDGMGRPSRRHRGREGAGAGRPLLIDRQIIVSVDRLVDSLWGDNDGPGAEIALRSTISRLRKRLREAGAPEDVILTRAPGYMLAVPAEVTDVFRFERVVARGPPRARAPAPERMRAAVDRGGGLLARAGLQRGAGRAVRPGRGPAARRVAADGPRGEDRRRADARPSRGRHRRTGSPDERQPDARATVVPAHAGALPVGPPSRGPAGLPGSSGHPGGRARDRAGARRDLDGTRHPRPGPGAGLRLPARRRQRARRRRRPRC